MKKYLVLFLLLGIGFSSCEDFLNLIPKNQKVVTTVDDVRVEMIGYWSAHTYANVPVLSYGSASNLSLPIYNDVNTHLCIYGDNLYLEEFNRHSDINEKVMSHFRLDRKWKGVGLARSMWSAAYCSIGYMNSIIDDLNLMSPTKEEYETIGGEARLVRAWCLFKLIQFFCPYDKDQFGVPLNLDSQNTEPQPRKTQKELYAFIEEELLEIATFTTVPEEWNFFYNSSFIHSFMAEMYMFKAMSAAAEEGDWAAAETYSNEVIKNYNIENSVGILSALFATSNIQYTTKNPNCALRLATNRTCGIGGQYTSIWGLNNAQQVSSELWALYAENDIRRKAWFDEKEEEGVARIYVSKPSVNLWGPAADLLVLYRKADLYLINCEAKCRQGGKDKEAADMLYKFRTCRIPGYNEPIGNNVLEEVLKERRRELCFEYGSRWLDMKRLGVTCKRTYQEEGSTEMIEDVLLSDDYRYALPIPTDIEIDYNDIPQNPGWNTIE